MKLFYSLAVFLKFKNRNTHYLILGADQKEQNHFGKIMAHFLLKIFLRFIIALQSPVIWVHCLQNMECPSWDYLFVGILLQKLNNSSNI